MRLKDVVAMNLWTLPETTLPDYRFRYIDIGSVHSDGTIDDSEVIRFEDAPSRARRIVKQNDVLVSTVRTYLRAIAAIDFVAQDVIASTGFAVCTPNSKTLPKYLSYALRADSVIDEICKESSGISYPAINSTMLSAIEIPYCDAVEQAKKVSYLDEKTAAIDARVAVLEKKKAAYQRLKTSVINRAVTRGLDPNVKLKDSGVDWIGQVPEGWNVLRVKSLVSEPGSCFVDGDWINLEDISESGIRYLTSGNVGPGCFKEQGDGYVSEETFQRLKCLPVHAGDILISRLNLPIGRACVVPACFVRCVVAVDCVVFRPDRTCDKAYLVYAMSTSRYLDYAKLYARGTTMQRITRTHLATLKLPIPPLHEQKAIAKYLRVECAKIDKAVEVVGRQIEAYKRLKRSLINEVVTGKRRVA